MVIADLGDGRHQCVRHHVGGIVPAAQTGLQHHQITLFAGKPQQSQCRDGLKLHRGLPALLMDSGDGIQHLLRQRGQGAGRDHLAVDLEPLPEIHHIGADGQAGLVTGSRQDGSRHGRQAALAVGAGNMHALQLLLGVAQVCQQIPHPLQSGFAAAQPGQCMQGFHCLLGRHSDCSSLSSSHSPAAGRSPSPNCAS